MDTFITIVMCSFSLLTITWLISIPLRNVSIIDISWGLGFVFSAATLWIIQDSPSARTTLVTILISVWGLRLTWHIGSRNIGHAEDFRYQEIRAKYGQAFWWQSLFIIFFFQAAIMSLIAMPLIPIHAADQPGLSWLDYSGTALWIIGFIFEAGGDWQLRQFKLNPENKGKLLTTGLWSLTRHPNYFGDAMQWWGIFVIALATPYGWATILSPIFMTLLLVKYTGAGLLEKSLAKAKPGYEDYIANTPMFFPRLWPKFRGD